MKALSFIFSSSYEDAMRKKLFPGDIYSDFEWASLHDCMMVVLDNIRIYLFIFDASVNLSLYDIIST